MTDGPSLPGLLHHRPHGRRTAVLDHADFLEIETGIEVTIPRACHLQVRGQPALVNRLEPVTREHGAEPVTLRRRIDASSDSSSRDLVALELGDDDYMVTLCTCQSVSGRRKAPAAVIQLGVARPERHGA